MTRLPAIMFFFLGLSMLRSAVWAASLPASNDATSASRPVPQAGNSVSHSKTVQVTTRRDGDRIQFYVQNDELCEVTMTFDLGLKNLEGSVEFPLTRVFPASQTTEAFVLEPIDRCAKWEYTFTNHFKLGSSEVRHDDRHVYELPYAPGERFKVTQAANGTYSHKGSNKYAIDWKMPEGTLVHAARGGVVVKTKSDSDQGGASMDYDCYNNFILIRHDDGTLGHYCHLEQGGCLVHPGDRVSAGQAIGRSGNTGFSSGPHLHFCVFLTRSGTVRDSVPIRFRTLKGNAEDLIAGRSYRAPEAELTGLETGLATVTVPERENGRVPMTMGKGRSE